MDELLGFMVLSGPLWFIIIYIPFAFWLSGVVTKRLAGSFARTAAVIMIFALPFADEITGWMYFKYLYATKVSVTVYHAME